MYDGGVRACSAAVGALLLGVVAAGCSARDGGSAGQPRTEQPPSQRGDRPPSQPVPEERSSEPSPTTAPGPQPSDGRPRRALLDIPELGIDDLAVVPYRGVTDDAPGTEIQDRGIAASPYGPRGGAGPGGVGNYQVTAHRLSSTQAFRFLPDLRRGHRVHVEAGGVRYTYRIITTRRTSFRSEQSLREQRAAVPGRPGAEPTRAMITLSTCRTPEDRAEGNHWSDEFGNPENRIDKIGVLVKASPSMVS